MAQKKGEYTIAYQGLSIGTHTFEFECDSSFYQRMSGGEFEKGELKVEVSLEKGNNLIVLDCALRGKVEVSCDRCLEEFMIPINFDGTIYIKFSDEVDGQRFDESEDLESDILWVHPSDDFIDLEQYIFESGILSLPLRRIHPVDENGETLCNKEMLERFTLSDEYDDDEEDDEADEDSEELDDGYNF